jgi:ABC-type sugar transport system substrate-binding protein
MNEESVLADSSDILRGLRTGRIDRPEFLRLAAALGAASVVPLGLRPSFAAAAANPNATPAQITKKAKYLIGFSQSELNNAWRFAEQSSMESEAKARADKYDFKSTNANSDTNKQVSDVADLIAAKCDLIVITPREVDPLRAATDRALAAGVPVIEIDRTSKGTGGVDYVTAITSDFIGEGEKVGHWFVANTTGPVNYVEFRGSTGAAPAIERHDGFHNVIDKESRFVLLDSQDGDFTLAGGKKLMTNWITRFGPKIDAIYAHNDAMAEGAFQAIKEAGFTKKIFVGSIDGEKKAIEQVAAGNFSVCVQCDPHYGKRTFDAIDQYFAGAKLPPHITVADKTFTKENAAQLVAEGF